MSNVFMDYVGTMMEYRKKYIAYDQANDRASRRKWAEEIKKLRYLAIVDGIDVYELEREVYIRLHKKEPDDNWSSAIHPYMQEAYLTKELNDIKNYYEQASSVEKTKLHQKAQMVRMRMHGLGLDVYRIEDRAHLLRTGEELSGEKRTGQHQHVADAIAKYDKLNDKTTLLDPVALSSTSASKRPKKKTFEFNDRYGETFSGSDMVVFMAFPGYKPLEIGVASTVSYTSYREKKQLRTLGRVSAKGITKGPRTISGRLIFTVISEHIVESLRKEIPYLRDKRTMMMDELPPFDILVSFGNEYGSSAGLVIQGATTVDEQKTMSIEDLFTENIFTYLARALEPMRDMNSTHTDEPYNPLDWFTSSFKPENEKLGKFIPKELQLYENAQLLPDMSPFYGSVSGWDSSKYDLSSDYGEAEEYTSNNRFTDPNQSNYVHEENRKAQDKDGDGFKDLAGEYLADDNGVAVVKWQDDIYTKPHLLIQAYRKGEKRPSDVHGYWTAHGFGQFTIYVNGVMQLKVQPKRVTPGDFKKWSDWNRHVFEAVQVTKTVKLPFKNRDVDNNDFQGYVVGLDEMPYSIGDEIKVVYEAKNYKTAEKTIHVGQFGVEHIGVMTSGGEGEEGETEIPDGFVISSNQAHIDYAWYDQLNPRAFSINYKRLEEEGAKKAIDIPQKELPIYLGARLLDRAGQGLSGYKVKWVWQLDLDWCDKIDNRWDWTDGGEVDKYNHIDKNALYISSARRIWSAYLRGVQESSKDFYPPDYITEDTTSLGESVINLQKEFYTTSVEHEDEDIHGQSRMFRDKLMWSDMPKDALLWVTAIVYRDDKMKDEFSRLSYVFRKG